MCVHHASAADDFRFCRHQKNPGESFIRSLESIRAYNDKIPISLSLNEHEVTELLVRVGVERPALQPAAIARALTAAREKIGFDELVVHTPEFGAVSSVTGAEAYALRECQTKILRFAGAGDSFNGGYLCASLRDLPLKQRLVIANRVTAYFVTHATAPTKAQLLAQIEKANDY